MNNGTYYIVFHVNSGSNLVSSNGSVGIKINNVFVFGSIYYSYDPTVTTTNNYIEGRAIVPLNANDIITIAPEGSVGSNPMVIENSGPDFVTASVVIMKIA